MLKTNEKYLLIIISLFIFHKINVAYSLYIGKCTYIPIERANNCKQSHSYRWLINNNHAGRYERFIDNKVVPTEVHCQEMCLKNIKCFIYMTYMVKTEINKFQCYLFPSNIDKTQVRDTSMSFNMEEFQCCFDTFTTLQFDLPPWKATKICDPSLTRGQWNPMDLSISEDNGGHYTTRAESLGLCEMYCLITAACQYIKYLSSEELCYIIVLPEVGTHINAHSWSVKHCCFDYVPQNKTTDCRRGPLHHCKLTGLYTWEIIGKNTLNDDQNKIISFTTDDLTTCEIYCLENPNCTAFVMTSTNCALYRSKTLIKTPKNDATIYKLHCCSNQDTPCNNTVAKPVPGLDCTKKDRFFWLNNANLILFGNENLEKIDEIQCKDKCLQDQDCTGIRREGDYCIFTKKGIIYQRYERWIALNFTCVKK